MEFFPLRRALLAALAGSTLVLAGAASAAPLDVGPLDTTPPQVIRVKPLNGSANAAPNTNIGVEFSEPMNKPATESAVKVERVGGTRVAGTFTWFGSSLVFDPAADLVVGAKYVAVVGTGAMDESGNALSQARTWEFKIARSRTAGVPPRSASRSSRSTTGQPGSGSSWTAAPSTRTRSKSRVHRRASSPIT
jgi:Bacterial Ig-like domain